MNDSDALIDQVREKVMCCCGEVFAINDAPLFHDRADLLNVVDVGERVAIEDDEVG